jgi:hypothetical protein
VFDEYDREAPIMRKSWPTRGLLSREKKLCKYLSEALGTLPEDGNVMPKHVGATIHN